MSLVNLEECELLGDSKYRAYISQVEKALKSFEYTSEWADLISALGKLNKVLVSHVKYPVIPKRVTIGKRLAQCLHPALPSGVHLKVLETYDIIFKCIGTQRLAADLFTYGAGLFPLLAYAAINVKPVLLAIYETHFVPLGRHIKPALTGVLLGLLPGLEEGSEFYDRTNKILEEFCESVEPTHFYGCLWECVVSCSNIRLSATNFVLAHFSRKLSMEDQLYIIGTNIDTMVEAMCNSVQDNSVLVQRSALELLLTGFPMHNNQLTRPDMVKVMTAVVKVVLRRDMSLNRRLYAWLLGTNASNVPAPVPSTPESPSATSTQDNVSVCSETEMAYFNTYSKDLLVQGLKACIRECASTDELVIDGKPANLRPFRVLTSLLDRPEIGPAILEDVLLDVFRHMYRECDPHMYDDSTDSDSSASSVGTMHKSGHKGHDSRRRDDKVVNTEIIKTANLLFAAFEPYFIWDYVAKTFEASCSSSNVVGSKMKTKHSMDSEIGVEELCHLVEFLMDKLSLETYAETQTEHLPELLRQITTSLCQHCEKLSEKELNASLQLCGRILSHVLPSMSPLLGTFSDGDSKQGSPQKMVRHQTPDSIDQEESSEAGVLSDSEMYMSAESDHDGRASPQKQTVHGVTLTESDDFQQKGRTDSPAFGDFVQYEDGSIESPPVTPKKVPHNIAPQTLIQACVHSFQELFCTIVTTHILPDKELIRLLIAQIHYPNSQTSSLPPYLKAMFPTPEEERAPLPGACDSGDYHTSSSEGQFKRIPLGHLSQEVCSAFSSACQLLVDFSCFPMYCTDSQKVLLHTLKKVQDTFPEWLQMLITCCCFVNNFQLQRAAVTTMLDLISLTQSVVSDAKTKEADEASIDTRWLPPNSSKTVSVVIVPALSSQHLAYLNSNTNFYKIVASHLWCYLSDETPAYHQQSVDLLYQLHQFAPSPWICEDVIGNSLLSDNKSIRIAAHKKFATLWHLLRERRHTSTPAMPVRTFDR